MACFSQVAKNSELIIIIVLNRNILRYILPEQGALGVGEACVEFPQRGVEPVVEEEQYSSGGKSRLGRITKAGDAYLRSLLVMGARAILSGLGDKQDGFSRWARRLVERRGYWKAVVAIAAKNARLAWAVLHYGEDFRLSQSTA